MRNRNKQALLLFMLAGIAGSTLFAESQDASLVFKAYRKSVSSTMTLSDFTLHIEPYSSSYTDADGNWGVTSALSDSYANTDESSSMMTKVGLFKWSLDYSHTSSDATMLETIYVTFGVSGPLINTDVTSMKVGYNMEVSVDPTEVTIGSNSATLSTIESSAFTGSVSTGYWFKTTYSVQDIVKLDGSSMSSANTSNNSFNFTLDSESVKSAKLSFEPQYKTSSSSSSGPGGGRGGNSGSSSSSSGYKKFSTIGQSSYSFSRGGTGYLVLEKAAYEEALSVTGRYEATITLTVATS